MLRSLVHSFEVNLRPLVSVEKWKLYIGNARSAFERYILSESKRLQAVVLNQNSTSKRQNYLHHSLSPFPIATHFYLFRFILFVILLLKKIRHCIYRVILFLSHSVLAILRPWIFFFGGGGTDWRSVSQALPTLILLNSLYLVLKSGFSVFDSLFLFILVVFDYIRKKKNIYLKAFLKNEVKISKSIRSNLCFAIMETKKYIFCLSGIIYK